MPQIEVLPSSTGTTSQPGYAFIPDTRHASQIPASQPVTGRKRAARSSNFSRGDLSVRQQNAILKHLADLDRDNHRDVQIPIPKEISGRAAKGKTTTNVRRILMSQKTFANHLADEEAALAQKGNATASLPTLRAPSSAGHTTRSSTNSSIKQPTSSKENPEADPLLRTYSPTAPSSDLMKALVLAPPLSYNAARAVPNSPGRPQRHFCEICGYWGSIRCIKCGARVCGLECQSAHDESRCLKFYA